MEPSSTAGWGKKSKSRVAGHFALGREVYGQFGGRTFRNNQSAYLLSAERLREAAPRPGLKLDDPVRSILRTISRCVH